MICVLKEEHTWHEYETCSPLLDAHTYVSFAHPERYVSAKLPTIAEGDSGDQTELAPSNTDDVSDNTSKGDTDTEAPNMSKDDNGPDASDNASEGDIDETYPETGNMPMKLWMDVMLVDSLNGGRVTCVPAPVRLLLLSLSFGLDSLSLSLDDRSPSLWAMSLSLWSM